MKYYDVPKEFQWMADSLSLQKSRPPDPLIKEINKQVVLYQHAFSPMAKKNLLTGLHLSCRKWIGPSPGRKNEAIESLIKVVDHKLGYDKFKRKSRYEVPHKYENILCIGYNVDLGNFDVNDKVVYSGEKEDRKDMVARAKDLLRAVDFSYNNLIDKTVRDDPKTLKLFMAPEFYFRGRYGAYPWGVVMDILPTLRDDKGKGTGQRKFKDWMFVYGTAVAASINEKAGGATIDNVAIIHKGAEVYHVTKEFISHIDFRDYRLSKEPVEKKAVKSLLSKKKPKVVLDVLPTEGARPRRFQNVKSDKGSHIKSKFADERMGGAVFTVDGITFGMEICLDHSELGGRLAAAANLQVMLLPSAGMNIEICRTIPEGISFNVDAIDAESHVMIAAPKGVAHKKKISSKKSPKILTISKPISKQDNLSTVAKITLPGANLQAFGPYRLPWP